MRQCTRPRATTLRSLNVSRQLVKAGRRQTPASGTGGRPRARLGLGQDGRHLRAAQRGPRLMEGQYERVSQSRELLYSVPAALCEEIARAATEELAERLSIPD